MQTMSQTSPARATPSFPLLSRFFTNGARALGALAAAWGQARADRRAEDQLAAMSDRELADIGLCRGNLHSAVVFPYRHSIDAFALEVLDSEEARRQARRAHS